MQLWEQFATAWLNEDASGVNEAAVQLAAFLPIVNADAYPSRNRLAAESWYFRAPWYLGGSNLTGIWVLYALTMIPLLLSVVFRWTDARRLGMVLFLIAFGFHTFALVLRWYVAARWPNTNMFEAVTTSAWFGGACAIILEVIVRRNLMAGLFALGSAAASMVALMCAHYMPLALNPNITNKMPVLHDVWLYIHTNVIIFSYALIFMAAITAMLYLLRRCLLRVTGRSGRDEYARVGGAGSLMVTGRDAVPLTRHRTSLGQVLDGTTMVLMELSFVMLWTGLVMGAIWADHSWGRPWGWDPKEVFALNTFIVFAVLIHTRLKVRDKGLWTAVLAVFGSLVMLFNWIFINFYLVGLHSYA
jgi:cytochrome c-type biogenesis protein CcsB